MSKNQFTGTATQLQCNHKFCQFKNDQYCTRIFCCKTTHTTMSNIWMSYMFSAITSDQGIISFHSMDSQWHWWIVTGWSTGKTQKWSRHVCTSSESIIWPASREKGPSDITNIVDQNQPYTMLKTAIHNSHVSTARNVCAIYVTSVKKCRPLPDAETGLGQHFLNMSEGPFLHDTGHIGNFTLLKRVCQEIIH